MFIFVHSLYVCMQNERHVTDKMSAKRRDHINSELIRRAKVVQDALNEKPMSFTELKRLEKVRNMLSTEGIESTIEGNLKRCLNSLEYLGVAAKNQEGKWMLSKNDRWTNANDAEREMYMRHCRGLLVGLEYLVRRIGGTHLFRIEYPEPDKAYTVWPGPRIPSIPLFISKEEAERYETDGPALEPYMRQHITTGYDTLAQKIADMLEREDTSPVLTSKEIEKKKDDIEKEFASLLQEASLLKFRVDGGQPMLGYCDICRTWGLQ